MLGEPVRRRPDEVLVHHVPPRLARYLAEQGLAKIVSETSKYRDSMVVDVEESEG